MGVSRSRAQSRVARSWFRGVSCWLLALLLHIATPSQAELLVPGSDDSRFVAALERWLDADEQEALPALSDLAAQEVVAAQMLLALIDKSAALQGPHLTALPRAERIALLRQPGGLSGRSWIHAAAEASPLAELYLRKWQMTEDVEMIARFAEAGEDRASREAALVLASRRERGFAPEVIAQPWFPDSLRHLTPDRALARAEAAELPSGHPMRRFASERVPADALRDWLAEAPLARPLRAACTSVCGDTRAQCTLALYKALGSYDSLAMMGSPSVALVPEQRFVDSPRGHQAVARRIMLMHSARVRELSSSRLAEVDRCATDWLQSEYQRYSARARQEPGTRSD